MLLLSLVLAATLSSTDGYLLVLPHNNIVENGSFTVEEVNAIREAYGDNIFWFRRAGREYIVRDRATLSRVEDLFLPQRELGAQQAALGRKQAALGAQQAQLGAEQARLGAEQARASERRQEELAREQDALARKQDELGRQQDVLGREQNRLGHQQDELARKAEKALGAMIDDLIRDGVGRPLHR